MGAWRRLRELDTLYLFFALNYLAQSLGGFVYEPISYLLKDRLGLTAGESARFVFWMTFPFLIKPLFGLLSDLVAVRGFRRRPYMLLVAGAATAAWLRLGWMTSYRYGSLLALLVVVNVGVVGSDVVCDAVMVEQGNLSGRTGIFQAVKVGTLYAALVATGLGGGWLAAHATYPQMFALAAALQALTLLSVLWAREEPVGAPARRGLSGVRRLLTQRRFWALSAFIFLWSFTPFLGTAQFYYQSLALKLDPVFIGLTGTLGGAAGALGALCYGRVVGRRWTAQQLARGAVVVGAPLTLLYLGYVGRWSVAALSVVFGFVGVALRLSLLDLAAQSCPLFAEATAFAAYMAVFDLAASASNVAGGVLYDKITRLWVPGAGGPYAALVLLTAIAFATTLACWPLLRLLREEPAQGLPVGGAAGAMPASFQI